MKYFVTWEQTILVGAHIEADTPEEAIEIASDMPAADFEGGLEYIEWVKDEDFAYEAEDGEPNHIQIIHITEV